MFHAWTICVLVALLTLADGKRIGPRHPATPGEVWPKAWQETKKEIAFKVDPAKLKFTVTGKNCPKIGLAIERCKEYIATLEHVMKRNKRYNKDLLVEDVNDDIIELKISLNKECEDYPYFEMDESYKLKVAPTSELKSSSVWGIIRGMESFTQLFYLTADFKTILINKTDIKDHPQYSHRALMLDTGRHFISVKNILKTLDAMAMNKMNVFHWHIVDDESFPYQSKKLPELSIAAFHPSMVYSPRELRKVRDHASNLGIRVLIEIDMPGHTYCWAVTHPEIITQCEDDGMYAPPLNPVKNETYMILKELLAEVQEFFPESFFHLGGDEVKTSYYLEDWDIQKYMAEHNLTDSTDIHALFFKRVIPLLKYNTVPIVWQDVFDHNVTLPKKTIIQTWRKENGIDMVKVLKAGYRVIQSAPFYLDIVQHEINWFYKYDPRLSIKKILNDNKLLKNVLGGTACMWGEMVDDTNVLSRVWPRASAIAEVLWSETQGVAPDEATLRRIEEQVCRMIRRGIPAEPASGPGFCFE